MAKKYRVVVFGKDGCDKCKSLNRRLDDLLQHDEWAGFEKKYVDVMTQDGLVEFCQAECVNPQRIPAFVVTRQDEETGEHRPVPNPAPGRHDPLCGASRLYQHLGLQTDYSEAGRGLITPQMIQSVLDEVRGKP